MASRDQKVRVLFVCLGNICRSPSAEGVMRQLIVSEGFDKVIEVDSAGTHDYHVGQAPDARACQIVKRRDIDISALRGRQVKSADFRQFDYILAMDRSNHRHLQRIADETSTARLHMLMEFSNNFNEIEVPDPYYGGHSGFDRMLDFIEDAAHGLLTDIRKQRR